MYLCKRTILRSAIDNCEFKLYNKNDEKFIKYDTLGGHFNQSTHYSYTITISVQIIGADYVLANGEIYVKR